VIWHPIHYDGEHALECDGTWHRIRARAGKSRIDGQCNCLDAAPRDAAAYRPPPPPRPFDRNRCRGCGRAISWGTTADGKKIPLDPSAPVYSILPELFPEGQHVERIEGHAAMVSHFATCSHANQFSASKRRQ
jgi:hypothetical protein